MHWLAYLAWPVAFAHSLTAGNDLRIWWVALIEWGSAAAVATAVVARVLSAAGLRTRPVDPRPAPPDGAPRRAARRPALAPGMDRAGAPGTTERWWRAIGPRAQRLPRLLPPELDTGPTSLAEHLARHGPCRRVGRDRRSREAADRRGWSGPG